jgi:hypothetical protein
VSALEHEVPAAKSDSPFLLLNYYGREDAYRFAGRDDEINAVVTGLLSFDTYVLYGKSGLGKTSLIQAGVFPELEKRGMNAVYSRVLDLPVDELKARLVHELEQAGTAPVVLVLDQFEEFFIRVREQYEKQPELRIRECRRFSRMLVELVAEARCKVRILFGIREDYYAELEDFRADIPAIAAHGFRLLPLTSYGARRAIVLPLERADPPIDYDQRLLNKIVDEVARTGFDPLLLQIICTEVWREAIHQRPGTHQLTAGDFERVGGFDAIFRRYVVRAAETTPERQLVVRVVLDTLITAEQTKRVVRMSELTEGGASGRLYIRAASSEVEDVLSQLESCQLLRPIGEGRDRRFELLHDRLVPEVKQWLASDKAFVDFRFAKTFVNNVATNTPFRTVAGYLISEEQMHQMIDPWKDRLHLSLDETELLFRSSVHGESAAMPGWALRLDEFSEGRASATIAEMLGSPTVVVKAGAARAVRDLHGGKAFVRQLLDIALEDNHPSVRVSAAQSFARLASDEELKLLAAKLQDVLLCERAFAVVVECYDQQRSREMFPWRVRHRAWKTVRARRAREDGTLIRDAMTSGAVRGAVSGALWAFFTGHGMSQVVRWNTSSSTIVNGDVQVRILLAIMLTLIGAVAGALLGSLAARLEARRSAVAAWEVWYGGSMRGAIQNAAIAVVAFAAWIWVAELGDEPDPRNFEYPFVCALLAPGCALLLLMPVISRKGGTGQVCLGYFRAWPWFILSFLAAMTQWIIPSNKLVPIQLTGAAIIAIASGAVAAAILRLSGRCLSRNRLLNALWTLLATSGPAMLIVMLLLWAHESSEGLTPAVAILMLALTVTIGSFRAAIVGPALEAARAKPVPGKHRILWRSLCAAALVLAGALYVSLFGYKSIPGVRSGSGGEVRGALLEHIPNTHYYAVDASPRNPRVVIVQSRSVISHVYDDPRLRRPWPIFAADRFLLSMPNHSMTSPYHLTVTSYPLGSTEMAGGYSLIVTPALARNGKWHTGTTGHIGLPFILHDAPSETNYVIGQSYGDRTELEAFASRRLGRTTPLGFDAAISLDNIVIVTWPKDVEQPRTLTLIAVKVPDEPAAPRQTH